MFQMITPEYTLKNWIDLLQILQTPLIQLKFLFLN